MTLKEQNKLLRRDIKVLQDALAIAKSAIKVLRKERRETQEYIKQMLVNSKKE